MPHFREAPPAFVWFTSGMNARSSAALLFVLVGCDAPTGSPNDAQSDAVAPIDAADAMHVTASVVVTVDLASSAGNVRDVVGVNKAPQTSDAKSGGNQYDLSAVYKALGVSQVRLHDGAIDLCAIYKDAKIEDYASGTPVAVTTCTADTSGGVPHLKWTVNDASKVNDIANYRFDELDRALSAIVASGGKAYVRLGHNYNGVNDVGDTASWAKVATNIYKHVIGTFAPGAIKVEPQYVEVFNEPDGFFWVGAKADFFSLFNATSDGVRAAAIAAGKTVTVGGPGFTTNYLTKVKTGSSTANGFITAVSAERLDFFSVHSYDKCATATLLSGETFLKRVRAEIDAEGLATKPMHITEWNIGLGQTCGETFYATPQLQSYISGMLTLMQDTAYNIEVSNFYAGVPPMSPISVDKSKPGAVTLRPAAWSLWAHSKLRGGTRYAAQVCALSKCDASTTATGTVVTLSGTANGKKYAIVTNDTDTAIAFTLRVTNGASSGKFTSYAPPQTAQTVVATQSDKGYRVDDGAMSALITSVPRTEQTGVSVNGGLEVNSSLAARSIELVELP